MDTSKDEMTRHVSFKETKSFYHSFQTNVNYGKIISMSFTFLKFNTNVYML